MTQGCLIIAHGSRRQEANDHLFSIADYIRQTMPGSAIEAAFLELAEPDIPTAVDRLLSAGITEITVIPFFLSKGIHWNEDIPEILDEKLAEHKASYKLLDPVGLHPEMNDLVLDIFRKN